jgi:hypothetical protein
MEKGKWKVENGAVLVKCLPAVSYGHYILHFPSYILHS